MPSHPDTVTHTRTGEQVLTGHNSYSVSFISALFNRLQIHLITSNVTNLSSTDSNLTGEVCKHEQKVAKAAPGLEVPESDGYTPEAKHTYCGLLWVGASASCLKYE